MTCIRRRIPCLRWTRSASVQTALSHAADMENANVANAYAKGISEGSTASVMTPAAIGITISSVGVRKIQQSTTKTMVSFQLQMSTIICDSGTADSPSLCYLGNGKCDCGTCECNPNYSGPACECSTLTDQCHTGGGGLCSHHGNCKCNKCQCHPDFFGRHCSKIRAPCMRFK